MAGLIISGILLQSFLLEKYYIYSSRALFASAAADIKAETPDSLQNAIEEIDRAEGISVMIADSKGMVQAASFSRKLENPRLPKGSADLIAAAGARIRTDPIYATDDETGRKPRLLYIFELSDGRIALLSKPLSAIRESAGIAGRFYLLAGLIAFLAGSIIMFQFSGRMTKPIIEMSGIARNMAELDFSRKVWVKGDDEIAGLGRSINTLSEKLEMSIGGLKKDIDFQKSLSRNISHELKTPIGVIKGYAEGLKYGVADSPEKQRQYLEVIVAECDRMDGLVKDMLTLSRLSARDFRLENTGIISMDQLISDIKERFAGEAETKGMNLLLEDCHGIHFEGNYELIFRALSNLVSNALKYTDSIRYIRVSASQANSTVNISVYNTCEPIPEEELPKLFDEFYRLDKSRSRDNSGHGLGLAIVKLIASLHSGSVQAVNTAGGIEFSLLLPETQARKSAEFHMDFMAPDNNSQCTQN